MPKATDTTFTMKLHTMHSARTCIAKPKFVAATRLHNLITPFGVFVFVGILMANLRLFVNRRNRTPRVLAAKP
jgi:hypothetical protein